MKKKFCLLDEKEQQPHIRNIFDEGELQPDSVVKEYLTTAADGKQYRTKSMGGKRLITYSLKSESGASLRGAGWSIASDSAGGGSWSREGRRRSDHPVTLLKKYRWEVIV